jgi:hypothetical protein
MKEQYYFIRRIKSHFYAKGTGKFATPKLYQKGQALRWCREWNKRPFHPNDGPWEVVPAIITIGEPIL